MRGFCTGPVIHLQIELHSHGQHEVSPEHQCAAARPVASWDTANHRIEGQLLHRVDGIWKGVVHQTQLESSCGGFENGGTSAELAVVEGHAAGHQGIEDRIRRLAAQASENRERDQPAVE